MANKLLILFLILPHQCFSQELLLSHPLANQREYDFRVKQKAQYVSFIDHLLDEQIHLAQSLAEIFAQAREADLSKNVVLAQSGFKKSLHISESFIELSETQQQIVRVSLESLQRLAGDMTEAQSYANQISKHDELFKGGSLDQRLLWMPHNQLKSYDYLSINGKLFEIKTGLRIPLSEGRYRVIALSNRYQPAYLNADHTKLMSWRPDTQAFVGGDCLSPQLLYPLNLKARAFFGSRCISGFETEEKFAPAPLKTKMQKPWILGTLLLGAVLVYGLRNKEVHWQKP